MRRLVCLVSALITVAGVGCASLQRSQRAHRPLPPPPTPKVEEGGSPTLTVLLSIDQLRADMPERMMPRFGPDGFRRLYGEGVAYDAAFYAHSATETAVGHATLSTGALPRDHGIVGNEWSESGTRIYSVDDPTEELLGSRATGKSPARLLVETLGDVLVRTHPSALVRSVSSKERAAILMAGKSGVAYWLDDTADAFVTSRFYASELPEWAKKFGEKGVSDRYRKAGWPLLHAESEYTAVDDRPFERGCDLLGCTFPHTFRADSGERLVHTVKTTPFGDELVVSFVEALLEAEPLGRDAVPDLLALSLSSTDYVGHAFGPESREAEDNLLRLDRTLARLFALLDRQVGRGHYVVVLSADHGACESPESFAATGGDAERIDPNALRARIDQGLRERFHVGVELVADFVNPSLVLHEARIASLSLSLPEVERAAATLAREQPGVHLAYARSDILAGRLPDGPFKQRIEQSTHPARSGHVYIVPKEHWLLATNPAQLTAMHGTPWPYDAHVPIVVWGTGALPRHVARAVDPRDIAPTLAALMHVSAPAAASGKPLDEALTPPPRPPAPPAPIAPTAGASAATRSPRR